ncbi:MAG: hypothetical protein RH860_02485 [Cytophagales bacterium]
MQAFYKEESKLGQGFIWIFILFGFIPSIAGYYYMSANDDFNTELPYYIQIILWFILILVFVVMLNTKLEFEIREGKIRYKMFPFNLKWQEVNPSDIVTWSVRKINPIFYAGGWGYRRRLFHKKKAMITRGNMGLELKMKNGKTLFLSSTNPKELEREMQKLMEEQHG